MYSLCLNRSLLYTAITRAKKKCIIIGDKEGLEECKKNIPQRITNLYRRENQKKSVSFCDCIIKINRNLDKIISSRTIKKILEKNGIIAANLKSGSKYYNRELTRLHSLLIQKSKLIGELLLFDVDNDSI